MLFAAASITVPRRYFGGACALLHGWAFLDRWQKTIVAVEGDVVSRIARAVWHWIIVLTACGSSAAVPFRAARMDAELGQRTRVADRSWAVQTILQMTALDDVYRYPCLASMLPDRLVLTVLAAVLTSWSDSYLAAAAGSTAPE